jgi:hypothetical protein
LFQKSKTQKYLLFFFGFVKFVAEFSLSRLHWSLVLLLVVGARKLADGNQLMWKQTVLVRGE